MPEVRAGDASGSGGSRGASGVAVCVYAVPAPALPPLPARTSYAALAHARPPQRPRRRARPPTPFCHSKRPRPRPARLARRGRPVSPPRRVGALTLRRALLGLHTRAWSSGWCWRRARASNHRRRRRMETRWAARAAIAIAPLRRYCAEVSQPRTATPRPLHAAPCSLQRPALLVLRACMREGASRRDPLQTASEWMDIAALACMEHKHVRPADMQHHSACIHACTCSTHMRKNYRRLGTASHGTTKDIPCRYYGHVIEARAAYKDWTMLRRSDR